MIDQQRPPNFKWNTNTDTGEGWAADPLGEGGFYQLVKSVDLRWVSTYAAVGKSPEILYVGKSNDKAYKTLLNHKWNRNFRRYEAA